jgi:hypothetical protein
LAGQGVYRSTAESTREGLRRISVNFLCFRARRTPVVAMAASKAMIVTTTMISARADTARANLFNAQPIITQDSKADSGVTKKINKPPSAS